MTEIKNALQHAMLIVDELTAGLRDLSARIAAVTERERLLAAREKQLAEKAEDIRKREENLIPVEQVMATARENDRARTELAKIQREISQKQLAIQDAEAQSLDRIRKAEQSLGNLRTLKEEIIADRAVLAEERRAMREKILKEMSDKLARG